MKTNSFKSLILIIAILCVSSVFRAEGQSYVRYVDGNVAFEQACPDSLLVPVPMQKGEKDPHRSQDFRAFLSELDTILRTSPERLLGVYVRGSSSPEGLWQNNVELSRLRTVVSSTYVKVCSGLADEKIYSKSLNEDWDGLYRMVSDSDMPRRNDILRIISTKTWGERKRALMDLDGGRVWKVLAEDYFPQLCCVKVAILCTAEEETAREMEPETPEYVPSDEVVPDVQTAVVSVEEEIQNQTVAEVQNEVAEPMIPEYVPAGPWWAAVKTDLASDALAYPQGGVEAMLGKHLSLEVMGWYSFKSYIHPCNDHRVYGFRPELRYWVRDAMTKGWFFGLHGEAVWYALMTTGKDLYQSASLCQNPETCDRRHFFDARLDLDGDGITETHNYYHDTPTIVAGLTAGYSVALDKKNHWGLEFVAGFGYVHTSYNHFQRGRPWVIMTPEAPLVKDYFGITRVSVNLSYRFSLRRQD